MSESKQGNAANSVHHGAGGKVFELTMRESRTSRSIALLLLLTVNGCNAVHKASTATGPVYPSPGPYIVTQEQVGLGIACSLDGETSPVSFLASDVGKPRVPVLSPSELRMLHAIMQYVHVPTLRFVFLRAKTHRFIVFDAVAGPCQAGAPGYFVLNGGCNMYYQPPLDFKSAHATPGCFMPPRPWIPHDRGRRGSWSWSTYSKTEGTPNGGAPPFP